MCVCVCVCVAKDGFERPEISIWVVSAGAVRTRMCYLLSPEVLLVVCMRAGYEKGWMRVNDWEEFVLVGPFGR